MSEHYDEYKDADPGAIGWALERQIFAWVVPWHEGSVRYLREIGRWNAELDAHNAELLRRQDVLAAAWNRFKASAPSAPEAFERAWLATRAEALDAADLPPVLASRLCFF